MMIQEKINLSAHTTLQTGGVAEYFGTVNTVGDLGELKDFADTKNLPMLFLGSGSNVLIADNGFAGLVVNNQLKGIEFKENETSGVSVVCGSGELLDDVIAETVRLGYFGLENLSAIPGTIGAAPVQNVGAYGVEMSELISSVEAYDFNSGETKKFTASECVFGYRDSFFKTPLGKKYFITSVTLNLKKDFTLNLSYPDLKNRFEGETPSLEDVRKAVMEIRSKKFPDWRQVGTAGSFFKNPIIGIEQAKELKEKFPEMPQYQVSDELVKIPLGYVLDKLCGLKGFREGNVGLYQEQALVLVNYGGANSREIKNFAATIAEKVFQKTNIAIEPEVRFF